MGRNHHLSTKYIWRWCEIIWYDVETFDWRIHRQSPTWFSLNYKSLSKLPYLSGGDILGWLSFDDYPMFVQMLQMTCLGVKDGFCSLNYLTWKFDSPRGISFHQPKTIKKTIQQTVLPLLHSLQCYVWYKERRKIWEVRPWFCHLQHQEWIDEYATLLADPHRHPLGVCLSDGFSERKRGDLRVMGRNGAKSR